jgi:serine/threonine-protein kinase
MILHNREARLPSDILERSMELDEDNAAVEPVKIESQTIGRYRLLYELGAGGMATVFLARAEGPGGFAKPVAIKRIHPHLSKRKELVEMFLDEARLASRISHPNVCNTFDFGEDQGTYYLAMEYLVGEPLNVVELRVTRVSELLGSRRWQRTLAKIVADACEGLHAAHEQKDERGRPLDVVHRDVSPHNVFVTYDGAVKVLDFGVAFAADRITKTVTGGIKGKLGYLAPEQLAHAAYDRRLDVWAIGIVLWEGLTGQRLFLGRTEVDTILAVENKVIAAPSSVIGSIPRELDAIAARCLSRAQADRYPTARAIARDLHAFLASSGPPLTSVEVGELVSEVCRDRREARVEVAATVANDETAAQDAETSQTRTVGGEATVLHDGGPPRGSLGAERDTDIRAPAPFAPLAVARLVPALAPLPLGSGTPFPHPTEPVSGEHRDDRATRITTRLTLAMVVALLAVASVAMTALIMVETGSPGVPGAVSSPPPHATAPPLARLADAGHDLGTPAELTPDAGSALGHDAAMPRRGRGDAAEVSPVDRGTGEVAVACAVSVEVCIRERCAQTPFVFHAVPVGRATLRFRAPDGRRWTESVSVRRNQLARVRTAPP